jgi:hypothetical protein
VFARPPVSVVVALTLLLEALSTALSLTLAGMYWTVTVHDLPGPNDPVQPSDVIVNAEETESETFSAPVALRFELVSVNVSEDVWPAATVP